MTPLEGALFMIGKGVRVFPLKPGTKLPYEKGDPETDIAGGIHRATSDPATAERWAAKHKGINFGGRTEGKLVADVDVKKGDGWIEEYAALEPIPDTLTTITTTGGVHIWTDGADVGQRPFGNHIDVRSHGGYCVCPGSVVNGKNYVVGDDRPIAKCPPHWLERASRPVERTANAGQWLCEPDLEENVKAAAAYLKTAAHSIMGQGADSYTVLVANNVMDFGIAEETCLELMLKHWNDRAEPHPWPEEKLAVKVANAARYRQNAFGARATGVEFEPVDDSPELVEHAKRRANTVGRRPVLDPRDPMPSARKLVATCFTSGDLRTLHYSRGDFYRFVGTHYKVTDDDAMRARVWEFLERSDRKTKDSLEPFQPTTTRVNDAFNALKAVAHVDAVSPPAWLGDSTDKPPARECLPCANGILHLPTRRLWPLTPEFFGVNCLPYAYRANAGLPREWLKFLNDIWPDDPASIEALQEWFGYSLLNDTRFQKILLIIGPKRSGKGTIGRVLTALLGQENVAGPTLGSLTGHFGLQPLLDRQLAIVSDARLGSRSDQATIAERLLAISGEDGVSVDRKHKEAWFGRLAVRFVLLTNETPRIADASGALASRFLVLQCSRSFLGREDHTLTDKLLAELPGILLWSLAGLERLYGRNRFVQPASGASTIQDLEDLGSPISAFVRETCMIGPERQIDCDALFAAWCNWCRVNGRDRPGNKQTFGRDLNAAVPGLKITQPRQDGDRVRYYNGIAPVPVFNGEFSDTTQ